MEKPELIPPRLFLLYDHRTKRRPKPVTAVQETSGKQFRVSRYNLAPGSILGRVTRCGRVLIPTMQDDRAPTRSKIIARVHPNTIHALLRRHGMKKNLYAGNWYEVHGD